MDYMARWGSKSKQEMGDKMGYCALGRPKRIRIAYLQHGFKQPGGGQNSLLLLLKGLNQARFEPIVVCGVANNFLANHAAQLGIEVATIPLPVSLMRLSREEVFHNPIRAVIVFARSLPSFLRIASWLRSYRIDLVHTDDSLMRILGGIAARIAGVPHVSHVRDIFPGGVMQRLYWQTVLRLSDRVVAVSEAVARQFDQYRNAKKGKVRVVYNAVDIQAIQEITVKDRDKLRSTLGISPDTVVIAMFGRLVEWKGHRLFLRACKHVSNMEPKSLFWIVGDGPLMHELKEFATSLEITDRVTFWGYREDALDLMTLADIVVNYSTSPDPFPRVVIEGMALGRAVVGPAEGGVPEALGFGEYGVLVEPRRPDLLGEALIQLIRNPTLRYTLGQRAQHVAYDRYSVHRHVKQIESIYNELLMTSDKLYGGT